MCVHTGCVYGGKYSRAIHGGMCACTEVCVPYCVHVYGGIHVLRSILVCAHWECVYRGAYTDCLGMCASWMSEWGFCVRLSEPGINLSVRGACTLGVCIGVCVSTWVLYMGGHVSMY